MMKRLLQLALLVALFLPLLLGLGFAPKPKLGLMRLAPGLFMHQSYKLLNGQFFPSNGLVVVAADSVLLVDTPWDERQTEQLLREVRQRFGKPIKQCIVTHAHDDRVAGAEVLRKAGVRVVSTAHTARLCAQQGLPVPDSTLQAGVYSFGAYSYEILSPGAAHAPDNIAVWLPMHSTLFGGCMIRAAHFGDMGNTADADLTHWSLAVDYVEAHTPGVKIVVPGHGAPGSAFLYNHTRALHQAHMEGLKAGGR